jgi:hypothetical protein
MHAEAPFQPSIISICKRTPLDDMHCDRDGRA